MQMLHIKLPIEGGTIQSEFLCSTQLHPLTIDASISLSSMKLIVTFRMIHISKKKSTPWNLEYHYLYPTFTLMPTPEYYTCSLIVQQIKLQTLKPFLDFISSQISPSQLANNGPQDVPCKVTTYK